MLVQLLYQLTHMHAQLNLKKDAAFTSCWKKLKKMCFSASQMMALPLERK